MNKSAFTSISFLLLLLTLVCGLTTDELNAFDSAVQFRVNGGIYEFFSSGYPTHAINNSVNPNDASVQNFTYNITINPTIQYGTVHCTSLGPVGFATNGVAIYNALTGFTTDGVKNEVFDDCKGHSSPVEHNTTTSFLEGQVDQFIGVAIDGHPIYGPKTSDMGTLTSKDLDLCHGRYKNNMYRYHITKDFPYVIGCYRAQPASAAAGQQPPPNGQQPPQNGQQPPQNGQRPPQNGQQEGQTDTSTVTCTNTDGGAQLCDCTNAETYKECQVPSSTSTCDNAGCPLKLSSLLLLLIVSMTIF